MAENEEQKNQKQDQEQNQGQNPNQGQYYLKLVAQGCFYFLDDSDEKTDEKIAGLYTQGASPCACIIITNQDNSKMVLAHVGDNNDISDEQTGLKHWIDLVSSHGQEKVQVEVHLGCGRGLGKSFYNDWFNRVKKVLQNQSIDGKKLYTLCKKNENNRAKNARKNAEKNTGEATRKNVLKTIEEIEGEAAEKVIIEQPIDDREYKFANETGIVLRKGYHLPTIERAKIPKGILQNILKNNPHFKPPVTNKNIISGITKEQEINQNQEQEQTVIFDDTIGNKVHERSKTNMKRNAGEIQKQFNDKLNQLVQQHYQKYLILKEEDNKASNHVEIPETVKQNADIKVPLTDQGEINEHNYEPKLESDDFQQNPSYFSEIERYKIDKLKLFQGLKKSNLLNETGKDRLQYLMILKKFRIKDDMNLNPKPSWSEYIENRENQTSLKIEQNIQKDHLGVKNRPNQTSLQRSNSYRF